LLNRLASNYIDYGDDVAKFRIYMTSFSGAIFQPSDFIQALIDAGHHIEVSIQTQPTTFGVALCVKEKDESWTNIPLAYFLQNDFSDFQENDCHVCLPHSGLNLEVHGPIMDNISIQHYIAIEGLCGWHSNHYAKVPWVHSTVCGRIRHNTDTLRSIRVAGLQAAQHMTFPEGGMALQGCATTLPLKLRPRFRVKRAYIP
jgi:hypothetical protein